MITNSVNNVNFGMARVKGAFRKLEIDALMEAYKKGSDALKDKVYRKSEDQSLSQRTKSEKSEKDYFLYAVYLILH